MAITSGIVHVTAARVEIVSPPFAGGWVHLFNYNEELDRPAYIGGSDVASGSGIPVYGGPVPRLPYWIFVEPNARLYAIADAGKDCWIGWLKTP